METFGIGEAVAENPAFNLRIAHVLPAPTQTRENIRFATDIEANRGKTPGSLIPWNRPKIGCWVKKHNPGVIHNLMIHE